MPISKITAIAHDGSFPSDYGGADGMMHVQMVTLEDGVTGQANTKNPEPPYGVGDEVEYTISGEYQGVNKLKVKKAGQGAPGGFRGSGGGGGRKSDPAGQMVGAAIHDAVALVCHGKAKPLQGEKLDEFLFRVGDQICQASTKLKTKWTPKPAPAPQQSAQPQGTGRTPPAVQNAQGQPVPTQSAHQPQPQVPTNSVSIDDDSDDIPF